MDNQQKFEQWLRSETASTNHSRYGDGYERYEIDLAWRAWQAGQRREHVATAVVYPIDKPGHSMGESVFVGACVFCMVLAAIYLLRTAMH